jgi:hypothetical protein
MGEGVVKSWAELPFLLKEGSLKVDPTASVRTMEAHAP